VGKIKKNMKDIFKESEEKTHLFVTMYLRTVYPKVIFNTDMSGVKLTMGQAIKLNKLRSSKGFPDLVIYEPRGEYHGLFLELKRPGESIYKKDGSLRKSEHLEEQQSMHNELRKRGYKCEFAVGYDEAKVLIDNYLKHGY
jgi:hypothetical protein